MADGDFTFTLCDPCHCLDLGSKDLARIECIKVILDLAAEINKFVCRNRVGNIILEMVAGGVISHSRVGYILPETRMNLTYLVVDAALSQREVIGMLQTEPSFIRYMATRTPADRRKINAFFDKCTRQTWEKLKMVKELTGYFHGAQSLCSAENTPLSCYVLVVRALWNGICNSCHKEEFDAVLGEGAGEAVKEIIGIRVNLDGEPIPGSKVGFIDTFHIWCFICDPYSHDWRNTFKIEGEGGLRCHAKNMIAHFVPNNTPEDKEDRKNLLQEFEVSHQNLARCIYLATAMAKTYTLLSLVYPRSSGPTLDDGLIFGMMPSLLLLMWVILRRQIGHSMSLRFMSGSRITSIYRDASDSLTSTIPTLTCTAVLSGIFSQCAQRDLLMWSVLPNHSRTIC